MSINLSPQDELLLIEALINYWREFEATQPRRSDRAWKIAEDISDSHGLELRDAIRQIEYEEVNHDRN